MGCKVLFWGRLANPSIKLLGYIRNRKIYDRGFACSQNPSEPFKGRRVWVGTTHRELVPFYTSVSSLSSVTSEVYTSFLESVDPLR